MIRNLSILVRIGSFGIAESVEYTTDLVDASGEVWDTRRDSLQYHLDMAKAKRRYSQSAEVVSAVERKAKCKANYKRIQKLTEAAEYRAATLAGYAEYGISASEADTLSDEQLIAKMTAFLISKPDGDDTKRRRVSNVNVEPVEDEKSVTELLAEALLAQKETPKVDPVTEIVPEGNADDADDIGDISLSDILGKPDEDQGNEEEAPK